MVKCTPHILFLIFRHCNFSQASKNTQQFQALNGLKCSTVDNLGFCWAFVIMLLGLTHFFWEESQKRSKFSDLVEFQPRNDDSADPTCSCVVSLQLHF